MAWTFLIGDTYPQPNNPLNLQTEVTWSNDETGEIIITKHFGHDVDKTIKNHCRAMLNNVLPTRDAAKAAMAELKGKSLDLEPTPEELKAQAAAVAQFEFQTKLREAQVFAQVTALNDVELNDAFAALQVDRVTTIPVLKG